MDHAAGLPRGGTTVLVTREVRWFHSVGLPPSVLAWFCATAGTCEHEHRTDHYDLHAAELGAGVKYRNSTSTDAKFRLAPLGYLDIAPGLTGRVDDWIKVSTPIDAPVPPFGAGFVGVHKVLHTRSVVLPPSNGDGRQSGCDIELAAVTSGRLSAWSFCLETFGKPEDRAAAFAAGIAGLAELGSPPPEFAHGREDSFGYPLFVSRLAHAV